LCIPARSRVITLERATSNKAVCQRGTDDANLTHIAQNVDKLPTFSPVYVKAMGAVRDARLDLTLKEVEVGRLPLPLETLA
jgi:hypothetical protein